MGKLAVLGSGGFAKEVAELAQLNGHIIEACYSAQEGEFKGLHRGYLKELESDRDEFDGVIVGVGAIDRRSLAIRRGLVDWLVDRQFRCPPIVSPHAVCAQGVTIGEGVVVAHGVIMGVDSQAASFAIFNSGSMVGHDARIGANVIIAPGAFLGGGVQVGENSLVGPLAKVLQGLTLGEDTLVGVGCLVVSSLQRGQTIWPRLDRPS